jgi:hypothetical protein
VPEPVQPTPPAGHVRVPSWQVTAAQCNAWGFPVRETEQEMGSTHVIREGVEFRVARWQAVAAGFAVVAIEPESHWQARHAAQQAARRTPEFLSSEEACAQFHRQPVPA